MAITSEDIHNQSFTVDRKGYDVDEVDVFLEHVAAEIDGLNAQIEELLARIDELNNNQMSFDDDEPMDMDAAFAEPAMPEPEPEAVKEEAAEHRSGCFLPMKKTLASPSSRSSFPKRKPTLPPLPMRS